MANNLDCKKCGSPDTKTFKMLYEQGASTGTFGGVSSGVGVGAGMGGMGVGANTTVFSGGMSNTSFLAERVKPPELKKKPNGSPLSAPLLFISVMCWMFVYAVSSGYNKQTPYGPIIVAIVATALWIVLSVRDVMKKEREVRHYNKNIYPSAHKEWQQMHMCMRCGHQFRLSGEDGASGIAMHQDTRAALDKIEGISQGEAQLVENLRWQKFSHGTVEYRLLEGEVADTSWRTGACAALVKWRTPEFPDASFSLTAETGQKVILLYAVAKNDKGAEAVERIWLLNANKGDLQYFYSTPLEGGEILMTLKPEKPVEYSKISTIADPDGYRRALVNNKIPVFASFILFAIVGYFWSGLWGAVGGIFIAALAIGYFLDKSPARKHSSRLFSMGDAVVTHIEKITRNFQVSQA